MSKFLQLHSLVSYPPSNLNRDDLGRPKSAMLGGKLRLRISSQALKRAWRTSEVFTQDLHDNISKRSAHFIDKIIIPRLMEGGINGVEAEMFAKKIGIGLADIDETQMKNTNLVFLSAEEEKKLLLLCDEIIETRKLPSSLEGYNYDIYTEHITAADIALFGRMLTNGKVKDGSSKKQKSKGENSQSTINIDRKQYSVEAAAQVAHAITVHEVAIEDDFFTAVDDLNNADDSGAGHLGEIEFGSGVFYQYVCINISLLNSSLKNTNLARRTLQAFCKAMATVAPTGKQNSFASRAYSSFITAEIGSSQPRSLHAAFLNPVKPAFGKGLMESSIDTLLDYRSALDNIYGQCYDSAITMNILSGKTTFAELLQFVGDTTLAADIKEL